MQNPFTTTFSKMPDQTYILTEEPAEIIENFSYEKPAESVYKITGVRGSGKTVTLGKVEEAYTSDANKQQGWLVYRLSPSRDLLRQFAAMLYKEDFIRKNDQSKSISVNASVLGTCGGFGISKTSHSELFDIGAELEDMIRIAQENRKKILLGIDEISKTNDMIAFASEFGKWLRADYPVYLVCTGLYENINELSNVKNLTFFRRATTIKTGPLNAIRMAEMYRLQLGVSGQEAKRLAELTKGYAYAFQVLGILYFRGQGREAMEDILAAFRTELFAYSYEKIWEGLSPEDRRLVRLLTEKEEYKREELLEKLGEKASSYSVYRDRLLKRGVITARQGYISLALPFFNEYVKEYGSEE